MSPAILVPNTIGWKYNPWGRYCVVLLVKQTLWQKYCFQAMYILYIFQNVTNQQVMIYWNSNRSCWNVECFTFTGIIFQLWKSLVVIQLSWWDICCMYLIKLYRSCRYLNIRITNDGYIRIHYNQKTYLILFNTTTSMLFIQHINLCPLSGGRCEWIAWNLYMV